MRSTTAAAALVVPVLTLGATAAALTLFAPAAAHAQLVVSDSPTLSVAPIGDVPFGSEVTVTATLTDPTGATIPGAPLTVTVDNQPVPNPFEANYAPGTHTVTVTFPGDGTHPPISQSVPFTVTGTPGKITGGGSVGSGVRNFGFVVQAKSRARVLSFSGNVEFQDKAAGLNLHATAITGLAVDPGGVVGVFTGTATVNGAAGYSFAVWVEDKAEPGARVDTFRIQIYRAGVLIYDNGGVLDQGGNIQVHRSY